jgi:hypothetical protein
VHAAQCWLIHSAPSGTLRALLNVMDREVRQDRGTMSAKWCVTRKWCVSCDPGAGLHRTYMWCLSCTGCAQCTALSHVIQVLACTYHCRAQAAIGLPYLHDIFVSFLLCKYSNLRTSVDSTAFGRNADGARSWRSRLPQHAFLDAANNMLFSVVQAVRCGIALERRGTLHWHSCPLERFCREYCNAQIA